MNALGALDSKKTNSARKIEMDSKNMLIPCAVFAFNRPDRLREVLVALRDQNVERLIVFVDGPRDEDDCEPVNRCRNISENISWVETELHFAEENHGLLGLLDNIDYVLSAYEAAVFVEDDCLPMPQFYPFMKQALSHYKLSKKVFSIDGYQPIPYRFFRSYPYSVVSTARFMCWGWATWEDRWDAIKPYVDRYEELFNNLQDVPDVAGSDLSSMAKATAEGRVQSWAIKVSVSTLWLDQVHLLPVRGLIQNTGVGGGTNPHKTRRGLRRSRALHNRNVWRGSLDKIEWPNSVEVDDDYAERLRKFVDTIRSPSVFHSLKTKFKKSLRQYPWVLRIWHKIRRLKKGIFSYFQRSTPVRIYDLILSDERKPSKRALLSYIVHPFEISEADPHFLRHINIWRAREMVKVLNQMGYIVDVIDYRDTNFVPHEAYDLFIGHGGINFEAIADFFLEDTIKIYFSTGSYWRFHNEQELARFEALYERRGVRLSPDRLIRYSEEGALQAADGVIGMGNEFTRETYKDFSPVVMLNDTALGDDYYETIDKDFAKGRDQFLYFAGAGNVHKGLDLLLEAFSELEQHLWICSRINKEFAEIYANELYNRENIHLVGWVQSRSDEFYRVMDTCNYAILPSCSEGGVHSVVECMNQGLIPIVSKECGLNIDPYGFYLDPCTIKEIKKVVNNASQFSVMDCQRRSMAARRTATETFSEAVFRRGLEKAIKRIISEHTSIW